MSKLPAALTSGFPPGAARKKRIRKTEKTEMVLPLVVVFHMAWYDSLVSYIKALSDVRSAYYSWLFIPKIKTLFSSTPVLD